MNASKSARSRVLCTLSAVCVAASGCAMGEPEPSNSGTGEDTATTIEPILQGVATTAYPEATLLTMHGAAGGTYACSAVLIAPRVVLTAGHCVDAMSAWEAVANGTHATSTVGKTFDWHEVAGTSVNPNHHDIGLVILDQAIQLSSYPTLATTALAKGAQVIDMGRINNGVLTNSFYKAPVNVTVGLDVGYPFDYYATDVIEHGDSGGPVFLPLTHTVVAINSGANGSLEVLARVDLLNTWIAQQVALASSTSVDAGHAPSQAVVADAGHTPSQVPVADAGPARTLDSGPPDVAPGASASSGPSGSTGLPDSGSCTAEKEPNDTFASATPMASRQCGALSNPTDVDWYVLSAAPGTTRIQLVASGDAALSVGYATSPDACSIVVPQSAGATGATITVGKQSPMVSVCVGVASRGKKTQTYAVSLSRGS